MGWGGLVVWGGDWGDWGRMVCGVEGVGCVG